MFIALMVSIIVIGYVQALSRWGCRGAGAGAPEPRERACTQAIIVMIFLLHVGQFALQQGHIHVLYNRALQGQIQLWRTTTTKIRIKSARYSGS